MGKVRRYVQSMSLSIGDAHVLNIINIIDKADLEGAVKQCSSSRGHAMCVEKIEKRQGVKKLRCS